METFQPLFPYFSTAFFFFTVFLIPLPSSFPSFSLLFSSPSFFVSSIYPPLCFFSFSIILSKYPSFLPSFYSQLSDYFRASVPRPSLELSAEGGAGTETPLWEGYVYRDSATGAPLRGPSGTEAPTGTRL